MKRSLAIGAGFSFALVVGASSIGACGGAGASPFTNGDGGGGGNGNGGDGGATITNPNGDGSVIITGNNNVDAGGGTGSNCSAASQLVYVLSTANDIYSFDPPNKTFTKVSSLQCQANGMTPNSMAVDRLGNAWVNYVGASTDPLSTDPSSGAIFKVDIATGACAATNIALSANWYQLGMGYSTASASDPTDTLYVAATNSGGLGCLGLGGGGGGKNKSAGLGTIDTTASTLTPIGPFTGSLAGQSAELTGTGDGRLFGFFVLNPVQVAQIDKSSGATSNPLTMTGVPCPQAWAFSFWGGDFYLYTSADGTTDSTVTHYTTADGGIDTAYVMDAGFVIVGAGVSTCAPTTQPPPK